MRSKGLSNEQASSILESKEKGNDPKLLGDQAEDVGSGEEWDEKLADQVALELESIIRSVKDPDGLSNDLPLLTGNDDYWEFDGNASIALHKGLCLPPNLAVSPEFWRWLAIEKFYSIIKSRMGSGEEGIVKNKKNYGKDTNALSDNRMAIIWFRADMSRDDTYTDDPYHLARRGRTDFWESGILRHRYAWARNLAKALVRFQYPDPDSPYEPYLISENSKQSEAGHLGVRELYKRLRQVHATVAFEYLRDQELDELIREESSRTNYCRQCQEEHSLQLA